MFNVVVLLLAVTARARDLIDRDDLAIRAVMEETSCTHDIAETSFRKTHDVPRAVYSIKATRVVNKLLKDVDLSLLKTLTMMPGFDLHETLMVSQVGTISKRVQMEASIVTLTKALDDFDLLLTFTHLSPEEQIYLHMRWGDSLCKLITDIRSSDT